MKTAVNPPKTPVTEGSSDVAAAVTPNVCKMPGPPAPFITTPLPNVGDSGDNLKKGTKKVLIEGKKVAVAGSSYKSKGDMASKGTGGGLVSASTHAKTEFTAPGSMDVKAEGKNVQLLGDAMTNNDTNGGATLPGNVQPPGATQAFKDKVGAANADALCKAACKAIEDKKKRWNKKKKYQNLMRKALDPKGPAGKRGAGAGLSSGMTSGVLTEVAQKVGSAAEFIGKWASAVGKAGAPFVKWDIVLTVATPGASAAPLTSVSSPQVSKIVEVKFPGDTPTPNQQKALDKMSPADRDKVVIMDVAKDCVCA